MSDLEFARAQIHNTREAARPLAPARKDCLVIQAVFPNSVAAALGLAAGDLLVRVEGGPAADADRSLLTEPGKTLKYEFYRRDPQRALQVEASGIQPGLHLAITGETALARFQPSLLDYDTLLDLWKQGEWTALKQLAEQVLELVGETQASPARVLAGGARCELGDWTKGLALVERFLDKDAEGWTVDYHGVGYYYLVRGALHHGGEAAKDRAHLLNLAMHAHEALDLSQTAALVGEFTGQAPGRVSSPWLGKAFPVPYECPTLQKGFFGWSRSGPRVSLEQALRPLRPGQVHAICLLSSYRANGPYDEVMRHYRHFRHYFPNVIPSLHVLTAAPKMSAFAKQWLEHETLCLKDQLGVSLLFEKDDACMSVTECTGSPTVFFVDGSRVVRHVGPLEPRSMWELTAAFERRTSKLQ